MPPVIVVIGVGERRALRHAGGVHAAAGVGEGQSSGPRLEIGHRVPLVAGDAAVELTAGGFDSGPAVAEWIPDDAGARRDVVPGRRDDTALDAGIAVEQLTDRCGRVDRGLLTGNVGDEPVLRIGAGRLHVPSQAEVQGHSRTDAVVVLHEHRAIPAVPQCVHRRVLRHRARDPDQEVRERVPGDAVVERPDAVVVEQRVLDRLVVRQLAAHLDRVRTLGPAQDIARRVKVAAGLRSADRIRQSEVTADCDLRQRLRALADERRAEIGERCRRIVQAAAEVPVEREPRLVDLVVAEHPGIADVQVVLRPGELLAGPGQVAGTGAHDVVAGRAESSCPTGDGRR